MDGKVNHCGNKNASSYERASPFASLQRAAGRFLFKERNFYKKNENGNMTPNKQFNTYKEGLDLEFLREYFMEHEERRMIECGEMLGKRAS